MIRYVKYSMIVRSILVALAVSGMIFAQQEEGPGNPPDATPPVDTHNTGPNRPNGKVSPSRRS